MSFLAFRTTHTYIRHLSTRDLTSPTCALDSVEDFHRFPIITIRVIAMLLDHALSISASLTDLTDPPSYWKNQEAMDHEDTAHTFFPDVPSQHIKQHEIV